MDNYSVCFMGGRQAGVMGLLSILSMGLKVKISVCYSNELKLLCKTLGIPVYDSIKEDRFKEELNTADILISVHGREIVSKEYLDMPKYGAINVHPYLYRYKGASPIARALRDKNYKASVGVHRMTEEVDSGEVLIERFINIEGCETETEVYSKLYPHYAIALIESIKKIDGNGVREEL